MKNSVLIALVAGAVVVAGAAVTAIRFFAGSAATDAAVEIVPDDAWFYANLFVDPSNDQKRALDELLRHFPEVESTEDALDELGDLLDEGLVELGLEFERDIEPWLGDQVAFFMAGGDSGIPDGAALLQTTDVDATRDAVNRALARSEELGQPEPASHAGTDYQVIERGNNPAFALGGVDDFFVIGTEGAFKAAVDVAGGDDALGIASAYRDTLDPLSDDSILNVYLDQGAMVDVLSTALVLPPEQLQAFEAIPGFADAGPGAFVLSARSDGLLMEASSSVPEGELRDLVAAYGGSELLADMPADAWLTFAAGDLGKSIGAFFDAFEKIPGAGFSRRMIEGGLRRQTGLDLDDLVSWMGDAGFFVQGTNFQEMGGGLTIESSDPDATRRVMERLRDLLQRNGVPTQDADRQGFSGFSVAQGLPAPIYALLNDRLIVTYGEKATDDAIAPDQALRDDPTFQRAQAALGDGMRPSLFVDVARILSLVDFAQGFGGMQPDPTYERDVKPWLEPLSFLIGGARTDGDRIIQGFFLGVDP